MNLTTDGWIPIIWNNGRPDKVSLLDAFLRGDEIRDLAVRPHERIALMRLLICIAQAALDGPKDRDGWRVCRGRLPQSAAEYLTAWEYAFELFGASERPRFLQPAGVTASQGTQEGGDAGNCPAKLDVCLAAGNNSTLFDNSAGSKRMFSPDSQALMLLTFQNFSPCGRISDVKWNGVSMGGSSNHAPCVSKAMLHAYVRRHCLADTLHANLLTQDQICALGRPWGRPIWEHMPAGPDSMAAVANATDSYLGRLVPMSRSVRLSACGLTMTMGEALRYGQDWREVAATVLVREREGIPQRLVLGASLERSIWREAHSITVLATSANQMLGGPVALSSVEEDKAVDLWCGALVTDKGKVLDTVESVLHIPAAMLGDPGRLLYQQGVQHAEHWCWRIGRAVSAYHRELHDDLDKTESRKRGNLVKQCAASHYWTSIDQHVPLLSALVEDSAALDSVLLKEADWATTAWGKSLARAAHAAYELACPHATPRQLKAFSFGLNVLLDVVESREVEPAPEEPEA